MDRLIIMFPSRPDSWEVEEGFAEEYSVVQSMPFFDAVLFDFEKAISEGVLRLNRQPDYPKAPAVYRGPRLTILQYKALYGAADKAGIRMTTDYWRYAYVHRFSFDDFHVIGETHRDTPATYDVDQRRSYGMCGWSYKRTLSISRDEKREVGNSNGQKKVMKDLDADRRVVATFEKLSNEEFDRLRDEHLVESDYSLYRNLVIQEWVELKRYGGMTNEWRGRFFDGQLFEMLPNSGQPPEAPEPPQWLTDKHRHESAYYELDFAELYDGDWLIIGADDGQVAKRALGQSVENYYSSLERVARESPHLPEWIWCLVTNVDEDVTHTRADGTVGRGTKHFSPGTKVYIGSEWHGGYDWWKFVVMGKPRHQRRLIQIYMDWDKLCNFRLKKVYDKRVIEHMTRFGRGELRLGASPKVYGGWDNTDKSKREIEEWVELLNRAYSERKASKQEGALPEEDS